ncbi:YwgA family protein [Bacillaceae bacterium S4-13-56]
MFNNHAKLMRFFAESEEVVGRKKLQKMIFILKKLGFPFEERYEFHFYGPYSEELTLRTEELCDLGFLTESEEQKSGYKQYRYTVTEEGLAFLQMYPSPIPDVSSQVKLLNEQTSRFLELVSTILYFDELEGDSLKNKVLSVKDKQNYSKEEWQEAVLFVEKLGESRVGV